VGAVVGDGERGERWRWRWRSVGVVRGVTLTAAGADSGCAHSSARTGDFALGLPLPALSGSDDDLADEGGVAFVGRVHRYGGVSPSMVSARVVARRWSPVPSANGYRMFVELADAVFVRDLRSETAVCWMGSQLTTVAAAIDQPCSYSRTKASFTATLSVVVPGEVLTRPNRTEAPRRRIWSGYGGSRTGASTPRRGGDDLATEGLRLVPSAASWRSTIICVAMPA